MKWSIEELIYGIKVASNREFKLWYRITHIFSSVWRITQVIIKWIFTGYCWATIWNLDYYLIDIFIERLKMFKKINKTGCPFDVIKELSDNYTNEEAEEKWKSIIDRLIYGFEVMRDETFLEEEIYNQDVEIIEGTKKIADKDFYSFKVNRTDKQREEFLKAIEKQENYDKETMKLFNKYFRNLWD